MDQMPHGPALIVVVAIIAFSLYRRFRSHVGRQPVQPRSMRFRMALLGLGAVASLIAPHLAPYARIEELAGIAAGGGLAWWGLSMTRFSADSRQRYYTPNLYLGLAISTLFIARIVYRFMVVAPVLNAARTGSGFAASQLALLGAQSGLTLALFGVVIGYYLAYYAGVLHRSRATELVPAPRAEIL
jgi:hypothetical protein